MQENGEYPCKRCPGKLPDVSKMLLKNSMPNEHNCLRGYRPIDAIMSDRCKGNPNYPAAKNGDKSKEGTVPEQDYV